MKASIKNIEQTIASEQYRPALSEEYQELFQRLTRRLEDTLPMNRARIISDELRRVSETAREGQYYYSAIFEGSNELLRAIQKFDPIYLSVPSLDESLWNGVINEGWLMGAPRKWPNDSSFEDDVDAAVECFKEIKRKYYFENLDGQGLLKLQPEEIRKSMEIFTAFDSQKKKIKERLVRSINKLFLPSSDDKKQLHIWTTHRYDLSQEAAVAISSKSVDSSELEIKMPRPADWLQGMEYMPNHIILKPKAGDVPVLTLDADFLRTLDAVENGYPVGLLAPQYEQAAAMFLQQLDNYGSEKVYKGIDDFLGKDYTLITIGSSEVQAILANTVFACEAGPLNPAFQDEAVASPQATYEANVVEPVQEETAWPEHSPVAPDTAHAYVADAPSTPVAPAAPVTNETDTELQRTDLREKCARINKVFRDYGINAYPVDPNMVQEAARFTRFSVELKSGETIRTLERFKTDIGIQLEANGEILIDHIKGTKYLSVDVPFAGAGKAISLLKHLNLLDGSSGALDFVAGQKADGRFEVVDIAKAPHMLIAGTTGSGKTIFLYSIIVSLLHKYPMEDLEFLIIDPKQTDFVFFEDLPNLYGGHVVVDAEEALEMIQRINDVDKEGRMQQLRFCRSRDIGSYNEKNPDHRMKRLIIIIDEYADLIQTAEMQGKRKEFEKFLSMLAQKVRSLGIHLIIATQRPSANIVTGVLKANIPYRISFRLPSHTDSQTILDMPGAENLLGKGDMLMVTDSDTIRMQGLYISEDELDNFVKSRQ